jgi:hypothetical protein
MALLLERGPDGLLAAENDRLSLPHLTLFLMLLAMWRLLPPAEALLLAVLRHRPRNPVEPGRAGDASALGWRRQAVRPGLVLRLLLAGLLLVLIIVGLAALFPSLRTGVLGQVDPLYDRLRLQRILEIQPIMAFDRLDWPNVADGLHRFFLILGISWIALPYLLSTWRRGEPARRRSWIALSLTTVAYFLLACYQVRWAAYAELLLAIAYAAAVSALIARISAHDSHGVIRLIRLVVIVAALFWWVPAAHAFPARQIETVSDRCPVAAIAAQLEQLGHDRPRTIMTLADHGPELLYRTRHRILSIPNHRPQPGFATTYHVLSAASELVARAELDRSGIDWLMLCPSRTETAFVHADRGGPTFYDQLLAGQLPTWLRAVLLSLPEGSDVRLFERVKPPSAAATPIAPRHPWS